jgi:putative transposase
MGQSRIQQIVNGSGLRRLPLVKQPYRRKNRRHMYTVPREALLLPGGLVYFDVKHLWVAGTGKMYQFTALDHATRILVLQLYQRITSLSGREFLHKVQEVCPQIQYVGSDNGSEFAGLFQEDLDRQKIQHVFSSPHSPRQNPYVERVIRTVIDEVYCVRGTEYSIERQQEVLDTYVKEYNEKRPHWSLGLKTPMEMLHLLQAHPS